MNINSELWEKVLEMLSTMGADIQTDDDGQVIIYTGMQHDGKGGYEPYNLST